MDFKPLTWGFIAAVFLGVLLVQLTWIFDEDGNFGTAPTDYIGYTGIVLGVLGLIGLIASAIVAAIRG